MAESAHGYGARSSGLQESAHTISQSNDGQDIPKIDIFVSGQSQTKRIAATGQFAAIATAMTVMTFEQNGTELAGTPLFTPGHNHSVWGRPDEALWVEAMDKEVIRCFTMGTWQIVDTADMPLECNVMGTCFSYKVKND